MVMAPANSTICSYGVCPPLQAPWVRYLTSLCQRASSETSWIPFFRDGLGRGGCYSPAFFLFFLLGFYVLLIHLTGGGEQLLDQGIKL